MAENLLVDGGFERDWGEAQSHDVLIIPVDANLVPVGPGTIQQRGNIFTLPPWLTWFGHLAGVFDQPEVVDAWDYQDPARVREGRKAALLFTFFRRHDAGFLQVVRGLEPGSTVRLTARPHAWSNHQDKSQPEVFPHPDDPRWSEGKNVGYGKVSYFGVGPPDEPELDAADRNILFRVGIDPTGGADPYADTVAWGRGKYAYNDYVTERDAEAVVGGSGEVTVFLRSTVQFGFKHCNVYWDSARLEVVAPAPPEPGPVLPPAAWPYPHTNERGSRFATISEDTSGVYEQAIRAEAAGAFLRVVKVVDHLDWLDDIRRVSPLTITVGRFTHGDEGAGRLHDPDTDLRAYAEDLVGIILEKASDKALNAMDYAELLNEPLGNDVPLDVHLRLASLMMHAMDVAEENGLRLALFSYAPGNPSQEVIDAICTQTDVFARAQAGGHILALHEGVSAEGEPVDLGFDYATGIGTHHMRYRRWYEHLHRTGTQVPLVVTEWYADRYAHQGYAAAAVVAAYEWWDAEASKDFYVWGATPFTFGPLDPQWKQTANYDFALEALVDMAVVAKDRENAKVPLDIDPPPDPQPPDAEGDCTICPGFPREQYNRTYVLMPPLGGRVLAKNVIDASWDDWRYTIGNSADDAGIGDLDVRRVFAIGPGEWPGDLGAFFAEHYPGVDYVPIRRGGEYQLRGRFVAADLLCRGVKLAYPTTHAAPAVTGEFGVWREDAGGEYWHNGLDIRSSWDAWGDEALAAIGGEVIAAGVVTREEFFGVQVRTRTVLPDGGVLLVRYAHMEPELYVGLGDTVEVGRKLGRPGSTGNADGDHLHIDVQHEREYADPEMLVDWSTDPEPPDWPGGTPELLLGLNDPTDLGARSWLIQNRPKSLLWVPLFVGTDPLPGDMKVDFSAEAAAGVKVYVEYRYSWSTDLGGLGCLPPPERKDAFVDAVLTSLWQSKGVAGASIGNEPNNQREWPEGFRLTPAYCAEVYNRVRAAGVPSVDLAPPALDPYFGPGTDCRQFMRDMWAAVSGADFVNAHGYIRGPDGSLCWSDAEFTDAPLLGMGLNFLRCVEDLLAEVPTAFAKLPFVVSEFNHLWKTVEPVWGWVKDERAYGVVQAAVQRLVEWNAANNRKCAGLALYRWAGDPWAVYDNPFVLRALREL